MKIHLTLAACCLFATAASAQVSVGASISINQPGVYGTINIGNVPGIALVQPQPIIIAPPVAVVEQPPVYLYVPVVQQRDWRRYCGHYNACGRHVYFVREDWVREQYEHEHPGWDRGRKNGHHKDRGDDQGEDHGHGRGHGHDKGRGDD